MFNDYKNYLLNNEIILKSQERFKTEAHILNTEEINRIARSSIGGKRSQTFDRIISYRNSSRVGKLFKTEQLEFCISNENKTKQSKRPYIPDHLYRILITGGSGLGKQMRY